MITGIGQYIVNTSSGPRCLCLANFTLTPITSTRKHFGRNYQSGIAATSSADTVSKQWTLVLEPSDFDIDVIEVLTSTLATQQTTSAYLESITGYTNQTVFYNLDDPDGAAETGDSIAVPQEVSGGRLSVFDNRLNIEQNRSFLGLVYANGVASYSIDISNMRRVSSSSIAIGGATQIEFIVEEPIVRSLKQSASVNYSLLITPVQRFHQSQSQLAVFGRLEPNPGVILDLTLIPVTVTFPFATGSASVTVNPSVSGNFSVLFNTGTLTFPQLSNFTVSTVDAGILYTAEIEALPPNDGYALTIDIDGGSISSGGISLVGTAAPGQVVTLSSTNLLGLFDGFTVQADVQGNWTTSSNLPSSLGAGTNYTITAAASGFANVTASKTINTNSIFNPQLIYN